MKKEEVAQKMDSKALAKSKRRHGLKEIDRKWAKNFAQVKNMRKILNEK